MCTAIGLKTDNNYFFGRTLDVCAGYGERVVIAPRNFKFEFRLADDMRRHYAVMGTANVIAGVPLFFDAMNEKGLCMAALNFPENATYHGKTGGKINVAPFELISFILGQCACLNEAKALLAHISVADIHFSEEMPHTPLHWIIGDKTGEITVESVKSGLEIYENPAGVLTNNPPFPQQLFNLKNYARLSVRNPENTFAGGLDLSPYSRGMGAFGLPGDWSSPSRFVRAAFVKFNYSADKMTEIDFFHILNSAFVPKGCVEGDNGFQYTVYSCCCDTENGIYHYYSYDSREPTSVNMNDFDLDGTELAMRRE